MRQDGALLPALDRLFAGPRDSLLTIAAFLEGLEARSFAFIVAALVLPNCIPTGIPLLSTVTGIPMVLVVAQAYLGRTTPCLPPYLGRRALQRGRLQDFLVRMRPHIERLEAGIHPRRAWWVTGMRLRLLHGAFSLMVVILALPIPFDNLFAAWGILFFCLALLESDGVMAMLGWALTLVTLAWTALLLVVGPMVVIGIVRSLF
ncbi:exopolysaccharide biosynthesis protein [soil metagenome]